MNKEQIVTQIATGRGYSKEDITAGMTFYNRKNRFTNPPGTFDGAGRFKASERTDAIDAARAPSRAYPYSELKSARTARHCAELFNAKVLHVKRICRALEAAESGCKTAHEVVELTGRVEQILKNAWPFARSIRRS
ncbi:hypothetical protein [Roseivivax marinus]|uniref:hypothetical protein n=1 Tax=Roseivivax marinus TaxID=1379903 RepID=UPI00103866C2|nr:hypothetical protein [Roseivivax marinus]